MSSALTSPLISVRRSGDDERGAVLVIGMIMALGLAMVSIAVANVGIMVAEKIHLQDTTDAAAYSAAVVEARYMNLSAYVNRAMIANYNSMAFNTALWASFMAYDHGLAAGLTTLYGVATILYLFPLTTAVGEAFAEVLAVIDDTLHAGLHTANRKFDGYFAQDEETTDFNEYIERYNFDILSLYQGMLFAAVQSARHEVAAGIATTMDPDVVTTTVLGVGAETLNSEELRSAVDYVIEDPDDRDNPSQAFVESFDEMTSEAADPNDDHPILLGSLTEASLDKFAAGRDRTGDDHDLRALSSGNLIPGADAIEEAMWWACQPVLAAAQAAWAACAFLCGSRPTQAMCRASLRFEYGGEVRWGQELNLTEDRVPVIARRRMRETNFFGHIFEMIIPPMAPVPITVIFPLLGEIVALINEDIGDFIADLINIEEMAGYTSGEYHNDIRNIRNVLDAQCLAAQFTNDSCDFNEKNVLFGLASGVLLDDHWDGTGEARPTKITSLVHIDEGIEEAIDYATEVYGGDMSGDPDKEAGVPKYDWRVELDDVGFPRYHYDGTDSTIRPAGNSRGGGDSNTLSGPSVAVVAVKRAEDINGLHGLGIGNTYDISAISRAQVYYIRNPNRPNEKPSLFNPHWVARLAPINSEETPAFLKKVLPYVTNYGLPIDPTH